MHQANRQPKVLLRSKNKEVHRAVESFCAESNWSCNADVEISENGEISKAVSSGDYDLIVADDDILGEDVFTLIRSSLSPNGLILIDSGKGDTDFLHCLQENRTKIVSTPLNKQELQLAFQQLQAAALWRNGPRELNGFLEEKLVEYRFRSIDLADRPFPTEILEELREFGKLTGEEFLRLTLGLQEALTNSLEHGNLELESSWKEEIDEDGLDRYTVCRKERLDDPKFRDRLIGIKLQFNQEQFSITISDSGKGFIAEHSQKGRPSGVDDPLVYGRGLPLITNAVDEVSFAKNGAEILLKKKFTKDTDGAEI